MRMRPLADDTAPMTRTGRAVFALWAGQEQAGFLSALDPSGVACCDGRCLLIAGPPEPGWRRVAPELLVARHEPILTGLRGQMRTSGDDVCRPVRSLVGLLASDVPPGVAGRRRWVVIARRAVIR